MQGSDLSFGSFIVKHLVNLQANPPLVKRQFQSLGRLHAELLMLGLRLTTKKEEGPEQGYMLFYVKGNILVRIKTRGSASRYRGGVPHLSVSLVSGALVKSGTLDTSFEAEQGKFHAGGGLVNKQAPSKSSLYNSTKNASAKGNAEDWADGTHFDFPDLDLDDQDIDNIRPL